MNETRLEQRLQALAREIDVPVRPAHEDLERGRGRLRRRRLTVAGALSAVVAVVGVGVVVTPGLVDDGVDPVREPTGPVVERELTPGDGRPWHPYATAYAGTVEEWGSFLAEHLDPAGRHLQPWREDQENLSGHQDDDGLHALSAVYVWTEPGQAGSGSITLHVSAEQEISGGNCALEEWSCESLDPPSGISSAVVATSGDETEVEAVHEDGDVVTVAFAPYRWGDPSQHIESRGPSVERLLAAASDPRLTVDGLEVPLPPVPPGLVEHGRAALDAGSGEVEAEAANRGEAIGEWSRGGSRARLYWSVHPVQEQDRQLEERCSRFEHESCVVREQGSTSVLVAERTADAGGGRDVIHRGPVAWVTLQIGPEEGPEQFPLDRGIALVLDERWQSAD